MANDIEFIEEERRHWGKIFTDITYAISEVSPFIDETQLKRRRYFSKVSILDEYMDKLTSSESTSKKKSFFDRLKGDDSTQDLRNFKSKNSSSFKQLESCSKCQCLACSFECKFQSCSACKEGSLIKACDKEKGNVRTFDTFNIDLTNNDSGQMNKYKVLAIVENCKLDKLNILLENLHDSDDKLILYYYPGIKSDNFGEITDSEEFDFVVETFQQSDY
ncbi:DUF1292 domain-containing protein [Clostridium vincentii]|uniref:DUF1292 domain-containing protein n=1 Tax=Clostridium vincentii TaxID=52704 RepID=A0A2T0BF54_9CLOT|nr:DUF1292 domain-containing protein [Clostridium vincentii]PRR82453.1 hypothetical protein CLVI_17930 [Clostridium vincentii]